MIRVQGYQHSMHPLFINPLLQYVAILISSIVLLLYSGDRFVSASSSLATTFSIPKIFIGTLIVSFATSVPEIMVTIIATRSGSPDIAIGNAIGSYISNIGLVVGLTALIKPLRISMDILRKELPVLAIALACTIYLVTDGHLSPQDGIVLIVLFFVFVLYTLRYLRIHKETLEPLLIKKDTKDISTYTVCWKFTLHAVLLLVSSNFIVYSATNIAELLNISEMIVGLTIVAIGTSLPELSTTIMSVFKGEDDIAIGNIIGSNVYCITLILGIAILTTAEGINTERLWPEFLVMIISTTCLWLFSAKFDRTCQINRTEGCILVAIFIIYLYTITTHMS